MYYGHIIISYFNQLKIFRSVLAVTPTAAIYWPQLRTPNGFKLNWDKFEIFSNLMTGKGSLLQICEANNVFGH